MTPMTNPSTETNPTAETSRSVGRRRYRHAICRERFIACSLWEWGVGGGEWEQRPGECRDPRQHLPRPPPYPLLPAPASILLSPSLVNLKAIIFDVDGTLVDS